MKELLYDVINILDKNNITYWAVCGTLIGVYRHKGFIPWDDDIDLGILKDDVPKLLECFSRLDYKLIQRGGAYKVCKNKFLPFPFIDLVIMNEDNGKLKLCYPLDECNQCTYKQSKEWIKEVYDTNRVFPLKKMLFEDFYINVPNDDTLVEETYDKCKTVARHDKIFHKINNHYSGVIMWKLGLKTFFTEEVYNQNKKQVLNRQELIHN